MKRLLVHMLREHFCAWEAAKRMLKKQMKERKPSIERILRLAVTPLRRADSPFWEGIT